MTNDPEVPTGTPEQARKHPGMTRAEFEAKVRERRDQFDRANDKITARSGRNLVSAVGIGLGLGLVMIFSLLFIKDIFVVFAVVLLAFTSFELATALRHAGRDIPRVPSVISTVVVVVVSFYFGAEWQWIATICGILLVVLWRLAELASPRHRASMRSVALDMSGGVFVQVYVTFLGSIAALLLRYDNGQWWVMSFLIIVVSVDVGAYATGLNFGKHPMAPTISPKKTWEGFAGSWIFGVAASVLLSLFLLDRPWWFGLILGTVLVFTATAGDLSESLLKRDLGIKDMSTWLPGHGGFLDRLDSILPSAAAAYVLFIVFAH
ncbi:phosphatidate cytidylyltransferase [Agreia sp. COWG]|uniref:phosphatidate cytidylyltransferase n=1 Tax=Agreia sp. COWG TaxID=2773266 RepID=UPI001AF60B37|nr:phosphatidate cytidylyltransferase [Agreia sp. COWG]CAD5995661.1 Phosphatidate cytidylyltransferase [Agreia sp. COWG]